MLSHRRVIRTLDLGEFIRFGDMTALDMADLKDICRVMLMEHFGNTSDTFESIWVLLTEIREEAQTSEEELIAFATKAKQMHKAFAENDVLSLADILHVGSEVWEIAVFQSGYLRWRQSGRNESTIIRQTNRYLQGRWSMPSGAPTPFTKTFTKNLTRQVLATLARRENLLSLGKPASTLTLAFDLNCRLERGRLRFQFDGADIRGLTEYPAVMLLNLAARRQKNKPIGGLATRNTDLRDSSQKHKNYGELQECLAQWQGLLGYRPKDTVVRAEPCVYLNIPRDRIRIHQSIADFRSTHRIELLKHLRNLSETLKSPVSISRTNVLFQWVDRNEHVFDDAIMRLGVVRTIDSQESLLEIRQKFLVFQRATQKQK